MNKSEIEWADYNWNPLSGCKDKCDFCYGPKRTIRFTGDRRWNVTSGQYEQIGEVKVLNEQFLSPSGNVLNYPFGFAPTFHRYRLDIPQRWKMTRKILVCPYGELFGPWVATEIIEEIFEACKKYPKHQFLFLTRYPGRYEKLVEDGKLPYEHNFWYGYSLPSNDMKIFENHQYNTFAVMEPLMGQCTVPDVDWLVIGADTLHRVPFPGLQYLAEILDQATAKQIPVYMSDSIKGDANIDLLKEYPETMDKVQKGDAWMKINYSTCSECGQVCKNDEMANFMVRTKRREHYQVLMKMCEDCFYKFCAARNIDPPKLAGFRISKDDKENDDE